MKRIGIAVLATIILGAGVATAQQAPPITPEPNATTVRYVYLGFVPKGPSFTFQDILQQKQQRGISPQP